MSYQRGRTSDYLTRLEHQKQIAQAELEHRQRELEAIRQAEQDLAQLRRKQRLLDQQIQEHHQERKLPPPIHGGREGLKEATREAARHDPKRASRKKKAA
jgi:serine phosphatase RsbU (regulator of sigma subunit)